MRGGRSPREEVGSPAVSLLLPCRDAAPWLPECIASLDAQTERDFEVLAVDDASSDATRELLTDWSRRDPRVRVLEGSGTGLVAALRRAASRARAPLLARMDADDVAHPERLAAQRGFLRDRPELAGCGTGIRYFPREALGSGYRRYERWLNRLRTSEEVFRDLFVECPVAHPTLMLRRSAYQAVGGYRDLGWPEDYDLILRLHGAGFELANLPRVLLRWRVRLGRLSMRSAAYSPAAFRRCKAHFLAETFLPRHRPVLVWGAGRVGKGLARALRAAEVQPAGFVDLDPRKIGQRIHQAPVLAPEELRSRVAARRTEPAREDGPPLEAGKAGLAGASGLPYVLIAVGTPGARMEIRQALRDMGFRELVDYRAVA